jgi:hypothetical protein
MVLRRARKGAEGTSRARQRTSARHTLVLILSARSAAVNAAMPNSSVRKGGMLKIIEVWEGRWEMLVR